MVKAVKEPKEEKKEVKDAKKEVKIVAEPPRIRTAIEEFRDAILSIEKGIGTKDNVLIVRTLRKTNFLRRKITLAVLKQIVQETLMPHNLATETILKCVSAIQDETVSMETEQSTTSSSSTTPMDVIDAVPVKPAVTPKAADTAKPVVVEPQPAPLVPRVNPLPEIEMYLQLFALILLIDKKLKMEACDCATDLIQKLPTYNRRTMDHISARIYFYYSLAFEAADRLAEIRPSLLAAHRTATLRHDEPSMIVLTNAVLRNYLHYNLYSQASKFEAIVKLDDDARVDNNNLARYHYYVGQIASMELHYSLAHNHLTQAIRKAPQKGAIGFRQAAYKLMVIVQLLMGDIPERSIFRLPALKRSLKPYFQLTQAVRVGDLAVFKDVMTRFYDVFVKDRTYSLIIRLRHNVIKTGLRKISISYSRISIKDICDKLHFDSEEDAEYILAKAIADGVIDAVVDSNDRCMYSKENEDMYSTHEPQRAFDRRIRYCIDVHNGAVKALRFPPNAYQQRAVIRDPDSPTEAAEFNFEPFEE